AGRPELLDCPVVLMGFSRNGSRAWDMAEELPARTAALVLGGNPGVCANFKLPQRPALAASIPALSLAGTADPYVDYDKPDRSRRWHLSQYPQIRSHPDVTWGMMLGWGLGHDWGDSWTVFIPYVQEVLARRAAGAGAPLKPPPFAAGWMAAYGWTSPWPEIAPVAAFAGERTNAIWLPGPATAHVWRAYQVERPLAALRAAAVGDGVELALDAQPDGLTAVSYYDRDTLLGTILAPPFSLRVPGLARGVRTLHAALTIAGAQQPTRPLTMIDGTAVDWRQADAEWKAAAAPERVVRLPEALRPVLTAALDASAAAPPAEQLTALRTALQGLAADPYVEQRSAAAALLKRLDAARPGG
ncbi:MAG: hypothetical protein RL456_3364, partial [Pseudomonadota bacterium]